MVLQSCSGTGGGIYAKLANGAARHNRARASLHTIQWPATALIEGLQRDNRTTFKLPEPDLWPQDNFRMARDAAGLQAYKTGRTCMGGSGGPPNELFRDDSLERSHSANR